MRHTETGELVVMTELVGEAHDALDLKPGRVIVAPGASVAWDDCCKGQLWVRMVNATALYKGSTLSAGRCPVAHDLTLALGIVRCVETVDDRGRAPTAGKITGDGHRGLRDMRTLADVVQGFRAPDVLASQLGTWTPSGPQGGCAGGEWTLTFRVGEEL